MSKPRVVVTQRWPAAVEAALSERFDTVFKRLDRPATAEELREALAGADALLPAAGERIDAALLLPGTRARLLAGYGPTRRQIDMAAARACGIAVTATPDLVSECSADRALLLLLRLAHRDAEGRVSQKAWNGHWGARPLGLREAGACLGIVGFGRIGQEVARRARLGLGLRLVVYDREPPDPALLAACGAEAVPSLEALLGQADYVSLHCSSDGENRHLIDAAALDRMKPSAVLINTAAPSLVDQRALINALWFETIGGAALDPGAPGEILPDLLACENVVLLPRLETPAELPQAAGLRVLRNVEDFFAGRSPCDRIV